MSEHPPLHIPGYALERELGVGGMATVYLATQTSLDRRVAIKILRVSHHDSGADPHRHEKRFLREGKMLARLSHKNVCGIFDIAKVGNLAYIAMEFIDGGTLGDRLRRGMTAAEAISVVVQLAGALSAAHAIGIVHRDLKPANVMMRGAVPVLTDFGIARDLSSDRTEITGDNILGTPNYMSPEQISGQPIDGRSDVYSLGAMLFELLTGRQPYVGDSPIAVCMQHLQAPIPTLPEAFAELQPVIDGMMAKNKDERIADMPGVVLALRAALLDSDTLRTALRFDTELPLSEQLRGLGFSLDGFSVESSANAKPRTGTDHTTDQRTRPLLVKPPLSPAPPPTPAAAPRRGRNLAVIAAIVALLVLGGWWWLGRELSPRDLALLSTIATVFDQQLDKQQLVRPPQDNARGSLELLHGISRTHALVTVRDTRFRQAIEAQVQVLAAAKSYGEARALLADAALVFDETELEQALARLDQAQQDVNREATIATQIAAIEQLLSAPDGIGAAALGPALVDLQSTTAAADPRYLALAKRVADSLDQSLQRALDQRDLNLALAQRDRLRELLPEAATTRAAELAVESLTRSLAAEQTQAETLKLLQGEAFTPATVDQILSGLLTLQNAGIAAADLREALIRRTATAVEQRLAARDLAATRALLDPVRQRYADDASLRAVETRVAAAESALSERRRADEEAQRAGRLALDAAPWGKVLSVIGSDGKAQILGADPTTPLTLTLPEGNYQITIQGPDGRSQQQAQATVKRGELSLAELRFAALDAETYLKQAGYQ